MVGMFECQIYSVIFLCSTPARQFTACKTSDNTIKLALVSTGVKGNTWRIDAKRAVL